LTPQTTASPSLIERPNAFVFHPRERGLSLIFEKEDEISPELKQRLPEICSACEHQIPAVKP